MKVVVLCLQGLGDTLMASPMIGLLRSANPTWEIHAVALRSICAEFLEAHPAVDRVHLVPFWEKDARAALAALPRIRQERFDISLMPYPTFRAEYHLFSFIIGAKRRVAHNYRPSIRRFAFLETDRLAVDDSVHNVVNNIRLLSVLGFPANDIPQRYDMPPQWFHNGMKRNAVGMHVGSITHMGNEHKRWPVERFIEVARELNERGYSIEFVRGPEEHAATDMALAAVQGSRVIEGTVSSVARSIGGLRAMIAGDNGIAHLSAGMGTPTIAVFGLTNPLHVAPWGKQVKVVRPSDCPPCFQFGDKSFECKRAINFRCLREDLQSSDVLKAFDDFNLGS